MGTLNPKPDVFVLRGLGDYSTHWGNIRLIVGVYICIYIYPFNEKTETII